LAWRARKTTDSIRLIYFDWVVACSRAAHASRAKERPSGRAQSPWPHPAPYDASFGGAALERPRRQAPPPIRRHAFLNRGVDVRERLAIGVADNVAAGTLSARQRAGKRRGDSALAALSADWVIRLRSCWLGRCAAQTRSRHLGRAQFVTSRQPAQGGSDLRRRHLDLAADVIPQAIDKHRRLDFFPCGWSCQSCFRRAIRQAEAA
jgi:hypothetical protein